MWIGGLDLFLDLVPHNFGGLRDFFNFPAGHVETTSPEPALWVFS